MTATDQAVTTASTSDLVVKDVHAHYGDHAALSGVDLEVPGGSVVAVLGSNGSGKSTLLSTIAGLIRLTGGSITLGGDRLDGMAAHAVARRGVCYIPEGRGVFPDLTVVENLALSVGNDPSKREKVFQHLPALAERARRQAGTLSGGEQQMLAIAPAIIGSYDVLMVDELSLGLAPKIVDQLFDILTTNRPAGASMVVVEQFADRALAIADTAYVLRKGQVVFAGSASELAADSEALHALYIGGA